jgi:hypothetical protein
MTTSDDCRRHAAVVRKLADQTEAGPEREALLQIAYQWDRLVTYKHRQEQQGT